MMPVIIFNKMIHYIQQDDTLNFNELINFCDFIQNFCLSLHDFILYKTLERMIILKKAISLGKIRQYRDKLKSARLRVNNIVLSVGLKTLLVNKEMSVCKFAIIEKVEIFEEQDIFINFNIEVKKNWEVYLIQI